MLYYCRSHGEAGFRYFDQAITNHSWTLFQQATHYADEQNVVQQRYVVTFDSYWQELTDTEEVSDGNSGDKLQALLQEYQPIARIRHAHFRYDLDDPFPKYHVLVFKHHPPPITTTT